MPTAIIIGASTGIGREIARQLGARGYRLGLAARRTVELGELAREIGAERCVVRRMDVAEPDAARDIFRELAEALGTVEVVYLVAGAGIPNAELEWKWEAETLHVNVVGFAALAVAAMAWFERQGGGQLVAVTSVAAVRPAGVAPAYGASKTFGAVYLEALRYRARRKKLAMTITEVRPGPVATAMLKIDRPFWVISAARAAELTIKAADRRDKMCYVPWRWGLLARLVRWMPDAIYARLA